MTRRKHIKGDDLSAWYLEVVQQAQLADYAPVKGCMVIRPNGYAIWENITREFDRRIKAMGVRNAYFPVFIPESFLHREKEHVEGFSPELAVVTIGGGKKLEEPLVVRPTSETIMYAMYSKWISSWRDLPLLLNQWCNVVRWEKRTFPFLRTLEFLWQEGHTAHETLAGADEQTMLALRHYREFMEETLALPVLVGTKSKSEKFAGALYTTSCEALMPDGKALQVATSHNLGQNFSKAGAFNISFQSRDNKSREYAWQTSWGMSTRVVGGLIMTHGDDKGVIMPPRIAYQQVALIPIFKGDEEKENVTRLCLDLAEALRQAGMTAQVDLRDGISPGSKFHDAELNGYPLRIDIGPKEAEEQSAMVVRRDTSEKIPVKRAELVTRCVALLEAIQANLFQRAKDFLASRMFTATDLASFGKIMEETPGLIQAPWCGGQECETRIKEQYKATSRVIPFDKPDQIGHCLVCGQAGQYLPWWGRSY